jgi:hypothetical protein
VLIDLTRHHLLMVLLLVIGVVAFFVLAALYGVDSRPDTSRHARRWV